MLSMHPFARNEDLASYYMSAIGRALSVLASQFQVVKLDATHVQVPAAADAGAAVVSVGGQWRWVEAALTLAHPGGAAGTYPLFVTAANNDISSTPDPFTDDTNYAFAIAIDAPGATPAIVAGVVDVFRHVADIVWDGAAITRVRQLVPASPSHAFSHDIGGSDPIAPADIGAAADGTQVPIGGQIIYSGRGDLPGGVFVVADGRLLDSTAFAGIDAVCGRTAPVASRHLYNLGVDPGSNKVRIPDKRGRQSIGAIDMGTGAGPNDTSHSQAAQGTAGGATQHTHSATLSVGSLAVIAHAHGLSRNGGAAMGITEAGGAASIHFTSAGIGFPTLGDGPVTEALRIIAVAGIADVDHNVDSVPLLGASDTASSSTSSGSGSASGSTAATATVDPNQADTVLVRVA